MCDLNFEKSFFVSQIYKVFKKSFHNTQFLILNYHNIHIIGISAMSGLKLSDGNVEGKILN